MSDSLRDQLLGLGFKAPQTERKPDARRRRDGAPARGGEGARKGAPKGAPPKNAQPRGGPRQDRKAGRNQGEIDLAKAYAIRAQREKQERIDVEKQKQEEARQRREARARLAALLEGKALNVDEADIARHFEYGGRIKRIYVTAGQLKALNAGELGVLQQNGRYVLVSAGVLAEAEAIFAPAVALRVDPDAPASEDPYSDPKYQVPDDLVW